MTEEELIYTKYATIIYNKIVELFENEEGLKLNIKGMENSLNYTCFLHALANVVPTRLYNKMSGDNYDHLKFNHLANRLCFQYMELVERKSQGIKDNKDDDIDLNISMN